MWLQSVELQEKSNTMALGGVGGGVYRTVNIQFHWESTRKSGQFQVLLKIHFQPSLNKLISISV